MKRGVLGSPYSTSTTLSTTIWTERQAYILTMSSLCLKPAQDTNANVLKMSHDHIARLGRLTRNQRKDVFPFSLGQDTV